MEHKLRFTVRVITPWNLKTKWKCFIWWKSLSGCDSGNWILPACQKNFWRIEMIFDFTANYRTNDILGIFGSTRSEISNKSFLLSWDSMLEAEKILYLVWDLIYVTMSLHSWTSFTQRFWHQGYFHFILVKHIFTCGILGATKIFSM